MKSIIFYFKLLYPKCDIIFEITLNYTITAWDCHFLFFSVSKLNLMMRCSIVSAALKTVWWVTFYSLVSKLNLMIRCCIVSADLKTVWELLDACSWSIHFRDGVLSPLHKLHIHSLFTRLIFYMYSYLWQHARHQTGDFCLLVLFSYISWWMGVCPWLLLWCLHGSSQKLSPSLDLPVPYALIPELCLTEN